MILYNVTISVDHEVHAELIEYVQKKHVPQVMASGLVIENKVLRLLSAPNADQGVTYSVQYFVKNMSDYEKLDYYESDVYKTFPEKFRNKFFEFRTVMEVL
ncbi:DUF4286 family protein [Cytophagaceae bacterium ABcell3]|nr:DUF4286 family protein [Cytophagaceae bacterium ABcell3]